MPALHTHVAAALVAASVATWGAWSVQDWRWSARTLQAQQQREQAERDAEALRQSDARQQRLLADSTAGRHAAALASINLQLGDARAHIARLSSRQCLDAGTVRMLNNIGAGGAPGLGLRAAAGDPARAAAAAAGPAADGYATERDTAEHIATCRAAYAAVSGQLDRILDIEDARDRRRAAAP